MQYKIFVISTRRPENVPKMQKLVGLPITWVVGERDKKDYSMFGAKDIVEAGGLCESRNRALELAFSDDKICVQVSDDLRGLKYYDGKTERKIKFGEACQIMVDHLGVHPDKHLVGVAPTSNAYFFQRAFDTEKFIVGDLIAVRKSWPRFDTALKLKEDYDFTIQHLENYGQVLRDNRILVTFQHRTNRGGAVDVRTSEREREAIAYLKTKWGERIRDNPRRKDEILLHWKGRPRR